MDFEGPFYSMTLRFYTAFLYKQCNSHWYKVGERNEQVCSLIRVRHIEGNSFCKEMGALNVFANTSSAELQILSMYEIPLSANVRQGM